MNPSTLINPRPLYTTTDTSNGTVRTLFAAETSGYPALVFFLETDGETVFADHGSPESLARFLVDLADMADANPYRPSVASLPLSRASEGAAVFREAAKDVPNFLEDWESDLLDALAYALQVGIDNAKVTVNMGSDWADTYLPNGTTEADKAAALGRLAAVLEARGLNVAELADDEYADGIAATYPDPDEPNGEGFEVEEEVLEEIGRIVSEALAYSGWRNAPAE